MLQDHYNETALWEAFILGDKEAYSTLYRTYHPRLYNYGHKFTANTGLVEDCIQEILIQFWINRSKLDTVHNLRSYLFVSYRRCLMKVLQAHEKARTGLDAGDYDFVFEASVDQVLINRERLYEQKVHLNKAVDRLTGRQREAVFFMFYENL